MEYGFIRMIRAFLGVFLSAVISLFGTSFSFGGNSITVDPAVFEGGGDCYCVIWETSTSSPIVVKAPMFSGFVRLMPHAVLFPLSDA